MQNVENAFKHFKQNVEIFNEPNLSPSILSVGRFIPWLHLWVPHNCRLPFLTFCFLTFCTWPHLNNLKHSIQWPAKQGSLNVIKLYIRFHSRQKFKDWAKWKPNFSGNLWVGCIVKVIFGLVRFLDWGGWGLTFFWFLLHFYLF